jgi:O-acetyl-ADP-ribose deacetylase (regulator of RNase III)
MYIDYRIGDMFKGGHRFIAHGCNTQGVMGSGVAKIVKENYSYAYNHYREAYEDQGLTLGEVLFSAAGIHRPMIFNCITQNHYGTGQRYANYGAIQECIRKINKAMAGTVDLSGDFEEVAFPMIGAGLAGGHWPTIAQIIERESVWFQPVVYDFTP